MTGQPPIRVIADAAARGSGPAESGPTTPTPVGWRELADTGAPALGNDAARFSPGGELVHTEQWEQAFRIFDLLL